MISGRISRLLVLPAIQLLLLAGCSPPEHTQLASPAPSPSPSPAPLPTPVPTPTPLYVPEKRLEVGRLFNGVQYQAFFSMEPGGAAATEAASPSSYSLRIDLHIRVPQAVHTEAALAALNPALPGLFPKLGDWIQKAQISPLYERLYRHKIQAVQQSLYRLDQLPSRHDFYDCETILEIGAPISPRKMLWIQSDMDVDSDGSDPDRVPTVDANSLTFQPLTSYKWTKRGANPNPFLGKSQARLELLQANLTTAATLAQREQIKDAIGAARYEVRELQASSFLVAAADPYIVVPGSVFGQRDDSFSPSIGDYCAVIYGNVVYPAIVGDVGPSGKVGEASLRIAQQLNPQATSENRPVSALKITYLVFPGTAERPFGPPQLDHWRERVDALLKEAGGYTGQLFAWKDLTAPAPTPTPLPSPSPTPQAGPASATPSPPAATASPSAAQ